MTTIRTVIDPVSRLYRDFTLSSNKRIRLILYVDLIVLVLGFSVIFSTVTLRRHEALYTRGFDLGNVDQALWNTLEGRPWWFTSGTGSLSLTGLRNNRLGMHFEPIYLFILPLYALFPTPRMLLILQPIVVALGAFPAYELGYLKTRNNYMSMTFATLYLLTPVFHAALLFDFHAVTLAPTFLLFAFLFIERDSYGKALVFMILAMACKEDVPLIVAMLGLYLLAIKRKPELGGLVFLSGVMWFCVAVFVFVPMFNESGQSPYWNNYELSMGLKHFFLRIGHSMLNDNSIIYLVEALFPTAFLALLAPEILILALPSLIINLASNRFSMYTWGLCHYSVLIATFVTIAEIVGYGRLDNICIHLKLSSGGSRRVKIVFTGSLLVLSCTNLWIATPRYRSYWWPEVQAHHNLLGTIAAEIPANAELSVQGNLSPQFSQRKILYIYPRKLAHYILLDMATNYRFQDNIQNWIRQAILGSGDYGVILAKDGFLLLEQGGKERELSPAFFTFATPEDVNPAYSGNISINNYFELHGYNVLLDQARKRSAPPVFELFLSLERPNEIPYRPVLNLLDVSGNLVGQTGAPTTLAWLPTDRWSPSKIYVVPVAFQSWPVARFGDFWLELSMVSGSEYPVDLVKISESVCLGRIRIVFGHIFPVSNEGVCP